MLEIINYFASDDQAHWLAEIRRCEWRAAKFLADLLEKDRFAAELGQGTVYLLADGRSLVSFVTLSARDCIPDEKLYPWIGFVHTSPEYRGHRYAGLLIDHAARAAFDAGVQRVYLATDHIGLYEKYGFEYFENRFSVYGEDSRVYVREADI